MTLEEIERKLGEVLEFLNQKADLDMQNIVIPENYDYVIESKLPTEEDPSWYRLYKSGWIEQGGYEDNPNESQPLTVNLLKPFVSTNYSITLGNSNIGFSATQSRLVKILSKTTDTITFTGPYDNAANGDFKLYWEAKGQSAQ